MAENMLKMDLDDISQFTNEEVRPIDIAEMDELVREMRDADDAYAEAKKASEAAFHVREEKRRKVLDALKACGKTKYHVDGLGTASVATSMTVNTPKDPESKTKLFDYISKKYGRDVLLNYLSINYQSLNSFVKSELEAHKDDPAFMVPGVGAPKATTDIRFRKE